MDATHLSPRNYQLHLLSQAKNENTIAVLNTGSGKTLVSGMLIKYLIDFSETSKICIFLAPTVPLVIQQAAYMRDTFSFKVQEFYGAMGVDAWRGPEWKAHLEASQVFVMTPQIFVDVLQAAFVKFEAVHLVVFDECHHARKNDPYSQIVGLWRMADQETRPKLFGMTASPSNNKSSVTSSIKVLESNLESRAFTSLLEHTTTLHQHAPTPIESIVEYPEIDLHESPHIYPLIHALLNRFRICEFAFEKMNDVINEFGSWAAYVYLERHVNLLVRKFVDAEDIYATASAEGADLFLPFELATHPAYHPYSLSQFKTEIMAAHLLFKNPINKTLISPETLSTKLNTLSTLLQRYIAHPSLCAIIFCQKRQTAILVQLFIQESIELGFIRSGYLIGHGGNANPNLGSEGARVMSMQVKDQKEVLEKFKSGALNLLVSTRVGEEGLDIQPCMLVIRYDPAETLINYIQSRGRARHATSHYINLCEQSHTASFQKIAMLQQQEIEMKNTIRIDAEGEVGHGMDGLNADERGLTQPLLPDEVFVVVSTGASCTIHTAVAYLHKYCAGLPSDEYSETTPEFQGVMSNESYKYTLTLPMMVPSACRIIRGPESPSKKIAKEIVCLMAIRLLHEHGELDDRLKATHSKKNKVDIFEGVAEIEAIQKPVDGRIYPTAKPKCFQPDAKTSVKRIMCVEVIVEGVTHTFGLLVNESTPEIKFSADYASGNSCLVTTAYTEIAYTTHQLVLLGVFHHEFLNVFLRNECFEKVEAYGYLICPLVMHYGVMAVDWVQVEQVYTHSLNHTSVLTSIDSRTPWQTKNTVIRDPIFYDRSYHLLKVLDACNPETPLTPELIASLTTLQGLTYGTTEHFASVKAHYKTRLNFLDPITLSQPLLLVSKIPYPNEEMYMVHSDTSEEKASNKVVLVLPQTCHVTGFDALFLRETGHLIPVIMRLLEHELIVHDYQVKCGLELVPRNVFRSALTVRNMRYAYDYERPELLGDSFLKFIQSMHLFSTYMEWHEGRLTIIRARIECNEYLRTKGMQHDLTSYILSGQFYRKEWTPAMKHGHQVQGVLLGTNSKKLSDKTIADCVEAIIGVCIESDQNGVSRELIGMHAINHLLSTQFHTDWQQHYIPLVFDHYDQKGLNLDPSRKIRIMADLTKMIGYEFARPIIALEAMTHASYMDPQWPCGCFQRLEFLGDAVLYYVVTRYVYFKYPELAPGAMTEYRTFFISNEFLACVSAEMGLINLTYVASLPLQKAIISYTNRIKLARTPGKMYWRDFKNTPKAVADVYESMVGAVFLDSGMDLKVTTEFILRTAVLPWEDFVGPPDGTKVHPTTRCVTIIQQDICCVQFKFDEIELEGRKRMKCSLMQHGFEVHFASSRTKKDAKYQCSKEATVMLEAAKEEFVARCSCAKKRVAVDILPLN